MKKQVFPNDVWIEILHYIPVKQIYPTLLTLNQQVHYILNNKIFMHDIAQTHLIPKMFIAKYFKELTRPRELLQISQLWKEQSPIYINDMITKGDSVSSFHYVTWRMDIIENSIKVAPEFTLACIPVSGSKALFVNLLISRDIYDKMEQDSEVLRLKGEVLSNFIEVDGEIMNIKSIEERNYIDLKVDRVDFVVNLETMVRNLPKAGLNPLETPFDLFFSRYKGKMINWTGTVDEILSKGAFLVEEPQVSIFHNQQSEFLCEGDLVEYRGRIGTLMSITCDQIVIKKPVTLWKFIQQDLIALGGCGSLCLLFKKLYDRNYELVGLSRFLLGFVSILGVQYNLLFHHDAKTKGIVDVVIAYAIYKYWGKWSTGGTHILFMILTGGISIHVLYNFVNKLWRKYRIQSQK